MLNKIIGIILSGLLLFLPGCGTSSMIKAYVRQNVSLVHIQQVAVLPFSGGGAAHRIREFTMTQLLSSGTFDVVDKGLVDSVLAQEAIGAGDALGCQYNAAPGATSPCPGLYSGFGGTDHH